jgi:hypothetical protein
MRAVIRFKPADGATSVNNFDMSALSQPFQVSDGGLIVECYVQGMLRPDQAHAMVNVRSNANPLPSDAAERAATAIARTLKGQLKFDASVSKEERHARIQQLDAKQADLDQKIAALSVLNDVQSDTKALLNEKLKQLRAEAQRLEMDRAAKEARRQALAMEVDRQRAATARALGGDAVAKELQNLVKLREQELDLKRKYRDGGGASSPGEIPAAEAQVSEAKIRLAEREAQLGKSGKGELLDRLTDELAMVSVDVTETELRLGQVRGELRMYDPRSIDATGLDRVIQAEPVLRQDESGNNNALALRDQYRNELSKLYVERFNLKVADVDVEQNGPLNMLGGRGGAGGRGGGFGRGGARGAAGGQGG